MLSSTIVALAVLASVGPALSVPVTTFTHEARNAGVELVEREAFVLPPSSAVHNGDGFFLRPLPKIPVHPQISPVGFLPIQQREELVELLARAEVDADESGASLFSTAFKVLSNFFRKRDLDARDADELLELFARADEDESGASLLSTAFRVLGHFFRKRDLDAREADELLELFARADSDESGAANIFTKALQKAFRQIVHLASRDSEDEESGSLLATLKPLISAPINRFPPLNTLPKFTISQSGPHIFLENLGPETVHARDFDSDSGALNLLNFIDHGPISFKPANHLPVLNTFPISGIHTRELLDLLARADIDGDSSEALSFSTLKNIGKIALNLGSFVGNLIPSHSAPPPPPPPAQTGTAPVQQRDLLELLTRANDDESGASIISTIKGIFNDAEKLKKVVTATGIASDAASIIGAL